MALLGMSIAWVPALHMSIKPDPLPSPRRAARKEEDRALPRVQAEDVCGCSLHFFLMLLLFPLV